VFGLGAKWNGLGPSHFSGLISTHLVFGYRDRFNLVFCLVGGYSGLEWLHSLFG